MLFQGVKWHAQSTKGYNLSQNAQEVSPYTHLLSNRGRRKLIRPIYHVCAVMRRHTTAAATPTQATAARARRRFSRSTLRCSVSSRRGSAVAG